MPPELAQALPEKLEVIGLAKDDGLRGRPRQVKQRLRHLPAADGVVRPVGLGVRLLQEAGPELLAAAAGAAAAREG